MTAQEFRKAVKTARAIRAYIYLSPTVRRSVKIFKAEALALATGLPSTAELARVDWLDASSNILVIGF